VVGGGGVGGGGFDGGCARLVADACQHAPQQPLHEYEVVIFTRSQRRAGQ
jgi:hypothetical protein